MYDKLIRDIQIAISNPVRVVEFTIDLAAEYSEACEIVNQRLAVVSKLLEAGYRDEAVQLAEQSPALLTLVAQLDFLELAQWNLVLSELLLEQPPVLMMDVAAQLERTYDELRQLEPLLKTNRLLALAQAPLQSRIQILNKLAANDPTNPIWNDDSEILQRARLLEIKDEFRRANFQKNASQLQLLASELQQPWRIQVPQSLLTDVVGANSTLARDQAREELGLVAQQLNECLLQFDAETARPLRNRWNQLNTIGQLNSTDEISQLAFEPLAWLSDLDQEQSADRNFEQSVHELEHAVEHQLPLDQLEQKIYQATKFDREIPENLVNRVHHYRENLNLAGQRKSKLRMVMIALVLLTIVAGMAWFVSAQSARRTLASARQNMELFVRDSSFDAGRRFFDGLTPTLRADGQLIRSHSQLLEKEQVEKQRLNRFQELIAQIELNGPLDGHLDNLLDEATELAQPATEKKQVEIIRNNLKSARQIRQNERNQTFLKTLQPLQSNIESVIKRSSDMSAVNELEPLVLELRKLIDDNSQQIDGLANISVPIKQTAENVARLATARIAEITANSQAEISLTKLMNDVSGLEQLPQALVIFANRYASDPNAADFLQVAKERKLWEALVKWQVLSHDIKQVSIKSLSSDESKIWIDKLTAATQNLELANCSASVKSLHSFLSETKSVAPPAASENLIDRLIATFQQAIYTDIYVVRRGDVFYYLAEPFDPQKDSFKYWIANSKTLSTKRLDGDVSFKAKHCQLAAQLVELLEHEKVQRTDDLVLEMLEKTIASSLEPSDDSVGIDPVVESEFIDQILLFAKYSNPAWKEFADTQRALLRTGGLVGNDWKVFDDVAVLKARELAPAAIDNFAQQSTKFQDSIRQQGPDVKAMTGWSELADYQFAGYLYQANQKWSVGTKGKIENGATLYCLVPKLGNQAILEAIGNFDSSHLVDIPESAVLLSGRPVFLRQSQQKQ